jgi:hypothetical protein
LSEQENEINWKLKYEALEKEMNTLLEMLSDAGLQFQNIARNTRMQMKGLDPQGRPMQV